VNFCSDNVTGAAPEILDAIVRDNAGPRMPYGTDDVTARVEARIAEVFERDCAVFLVATGTAANALALAVVTLPWGAVVLAAGTPPPHGVHGVQPAALSLTQATEAGTVYTPAKLAALAAAARERGLKVHMDGARFANAVAALGVAPADLSWRAGVDVLSFGASKNGALAAEAVVFFDLVQAETFAFRRKRAGHLFAKMRLLAVQMEAYLTDDLWLRLAGHANAMAERLAAGLARLPNAALVHPRESNQVFIDLPEAVISGLETAGFAFYRWGAADATQIRLVCAFDTRPEDVDGLIAEATRLSAA
jgi:threonine aldolase